MSGMNKFLSSITLVALGAIGGFAIFHAALQNRIQQTESNHNATIAIATGRFVEVEKERDRCIETDEGRLLEIYDLRGRLDAQHRNWHDLTAAQRSIATRQRDNDVKILQFQEVHDQDQRRLQSIKAKAEQKDRDLMAIKEELQQYYRTRDNLESELSKLKSANEEESRKLHVQMQNRDQENAAQTQQCRRDIHNLQVQMERKDLELENLHEHLNSFLHQKAQLEKEGQELQMRIRQKDEEIDIAKKTTNSLQTDKIRLERDVMQMRNQIEKMESQILEKDNELFKYREEEGDLETIFLWLVQILTSCFC